MSKIKHALIFRIYQHGQFVREDTLTANVIKIGKVPSAHLRINDDSVSRMHAVLEVNGEDISLIDLGSTRGTFVNGKKINKAKLQSGDVIQLGDVRIELATAAAAMSAAVTSAAAPTASGMIGLAETVSVAGAATRADAVASMGAGVAMSAAVATGAGAGAGAGTSAGVVMSASKPVRAAAPPPIPVAATREAAPLRAVPSSTPPPPIARPQLIAAPHRALPIDARASTDDLEPERSIEVAAMLGDSVIDVKHCLDPQGGRVRPTTWGLLAAGVVCLAISTSAFVASVRNSARNDAARDTWVRLQHRPEHAFRPNQLGAGIDWLAFGGLVLGLGGVAAGVWRVRGERQSPYYRIGTAPGVELAVAPAPAAAFPLVAPSGDGFVFNFGDGIDGELTLDGATTPLAQLADTGRARPSRSIAGAVEVPIPPRARIRARAGQATFLISSVPRPRRAASPLFAHLEHRALAYFVGSLSVHLAILALLRMIPPDAAMSQIDVPTGEDLTLSLKGPVQLEPLPEPKPDGAGGSDGASEPSAAAVRMAMAEGAAGDPSRTERSRLQIAHRDDRDPATMRDAILMAQNAGPLGSEMLRSAVTVLGATSDYANAFDQIDANGSIDGPDGPGGPGNFGGAVRGNGPGGGCLGGPCGTLVTSNYRTIGPNGPHSGHDYVLGSVGGRPPRTHTAEPPTIGPPVISVATYDKSIVRRCIRQHINEIAYCYEKQLLAHPTIGGDIKVQFFIAPNGSVQASSGEGFDPEVAGCLAGVIKTIAFPAPHEAGVQVNYPFHFHAPSA